LDVHDYLADCGFVIVPLGVTGGFSVR
jgi:hypothetical protein